jgi:predicted dehydrogenase
MIRLGLIGLGAWGKNYIVAAKESGLAEVVWAGREWQECPAVDGMIIATPPEPRGDIILSNRYTPMMLEKPVCLSLEKLKAVCSMVSPGLVLLVDYVHLFSSSYEELRMLVRERPGRIRIYGRSVGPTVRDYSLLWDHAPHDLAMCLGFGLDIGSHSAVAHRIDSGTEELDLNFDDDAIAHIRSAVRPEKFRQLVVLCGSWSAVYDGCAGTLHVNGTRVAVDTERPLIRAVRAFAQAVKDGGTDDWRFGIDSSVVITRVLEQAQAERSDV